MKNWGLRTRVLLLALLPVSVVAIVLAAYFASRLTQDIDTDLTAHGLGLTRQLAALAETSAATGDLAALQSITRAALVEKHVTAIYVYGPNGAILAASGNALAPKLAAHEVPEPSAIESDAQRFLFAAPITQLRYLGDDPFLQEGPVDTARVEPRPLGWVTLEISRAAARERLSEALAFLALTVVVVLGASSLLALLLARRVARPILRLEEAVAAVGRGELETRLTPEGGGDLRQLQEGFNSMADALARHHAEMESRIRAATAELARERDDAQRASAAKSRFLAAASHDLRQPLHALSLFAADLVRSGLTTQQLHVAQQIERSTASVTSLLDALLDISRLDVGGVTAQTAPLPLQRLFDRLETSFARSAQNRGLRFRCRPTREWVETDAVLCERLLANLIANAIEYTPAGTILLAARRRGDWVRVEVRDSGIGIAPEYQDAIFEEFYQIGNPAREAGKGLGLGLAIVERVRRILGIAIELESAPGRGSLFACHLRRILPPAASAVPDEDDRILWLVDGPALGEQLPRLATGWGWRVAPVEDLARARVRQGESGGLIVLPVSGVDGGVAGVALLGHEAGRFELALPLRPAKLRALLEGIPRPPAPA